MKFKGKKVDSIVVENLYFKRGKGPEDYLVFEFRPIRDIEEFERKYPEDKAPIKVEPGNKKVPNLEDPRYIAAKDKRDNSRLGWMIFKSLQEDDNWEFETVDGNNHETWNNVKDEMMDSGITLGEYGKIVDSVLKVNSLSDEYFEEAKDLFLATQKQGK